MKKIQTRTKKYREILILASVLTATMVFFPGCDLFTSKNPFPDAYYENNFIAGIGFDVFEGDNAAVPAEPLTGAWDFAYRYTEWNSFGYMTLADTLSPASFFAATPAGLSASSPVYRLSVVNLLTDGDFETGIDTDGAWAPTGSASAAYSTIPALYGIGNMKLNAGKGESIVYTPNPVLLAAFDTDYTYKAFFRYSTSDSFQAKVGEALPAGTFASFNDAIGLASATFPGAAAAVPIFTFLPQTDSSFSNLVVDNFRVTRSGGMSLRLLLKTTETVPLLESGVYSFSIWVHTDPLAFSYKVPYQLDTFFVTMRAVLPASLSAASDQYSISSGWNKLTATLSPGALMFDDGMTGPVIELIMDFNNSKPGQVLLAQPELRFNADGL